MRPDFSKYKAIIFDFDGVIIDSLPVKAAGFRECVSEFSQEEQQAFVDFHKENGGLPRFDKFRWFLQEVLGRDVDENWVEEKALLFSTIMKRELFNPKYQISETVDFIRGNYRRFEMHIASGTEEGELREICDAQGLSEYFGQIKGSPESKENNVSAIVIGSGLNNNDFLLIGDSILDFEAARLNGVHFAGYNNQVLSEKGGFYIERFMD